MTAALVWPLFVGYDCEGAGRAADGALPVPVTALVRCGAPMLKVVFCFYYMRLCARRYTSATPRFDFASAGTSPRPEVPEGWHSFVSSQEPRCIWMLPAWTAAQGLPDVADLITGIATADVAIGVLKTPKLVTTAASEHVVSVRCATFNACTLGSVDDQQPGLHQASVQHLLQTQCQAQGIVVMGIQETRLPSSCQYATADFLVFNAAVDGGNFGCSLWLSRKSICRVGTSSLPRIGSSPLRGAGC